MRKVLRAISVLILVFMTGACVLKAAQLPAQGQLPIRGEQTEQDKPPQFPELSGVTLTPEKTILKPGEILSMDLQTEIHTVYFGAMYSIERYHQGEWLKVFPGKDHVWIMLMYMLGPGPGMELKLIAPEEPGRYRYVKELTDYSVQEKYNITAEFCVVSGE